MKLMERDIKLMKTLGKYGVLNKKTEDKLFKTKNYISGRYTRRRLKKLRDNGYICKNNTITYLSARGKTYLESCGIEVKQIPGEKKSRYRLAKIAQVMIELESVYECIPSWKIKEAGADKGKLYYGKIINKIDGSEYYIYNIGKLVSEKLSAEKLKLRQVNSTQNEIVQFARNGIIKNVIILVENGDSMNLYKQSMKSLEVNGQLLIPFNDFGMEMLRVYGSENINEKIMRKLYGTEYKVADWKYADYSLENNKQVIILVNNDAEKILKVKQYIKINEYNLSRREPLLIICLDEQVESFKEEFRDGLDNIEIITISWEDLMEK